jgi:hypothetical protein
MNGEQQLTCPGAQYGQREPTVHPLQAGAGFQQQETHTQILNPDG